MLSIEKVARNLHSWPETDCQQRVVIEGEQWSVCGAVMVNSDSSCQITKGQWLAERARLQNKRSWDDAPEWADALVQLECGTWFWGVGHQEPNDNGGWNSINPKQKACGVGEVLGDWRDTLERRPDMNTDTSARVNTSDWDGQGLPPVGIECEFLNHITKTVDRCTVVAEHNGGVVVAVREDYLIYSYHHSCRAHEFRPIRTEEDRATDVMLQYFDNGDTHFSLESIERAIRAMYRAGYRKTGDSQ